MKTKKNYKDYSSLKLHLTKSISGRFLELNTINQETIGSGIGADNCFKDLFLNLGFDITTIDSTRFDLFDSSLYDNLDDANQFLKENNINYKVNYRTRINKDILFIELIKN